MSFTEHKSLYIKSLELRNFRIYEHFKLNNLGNLTLFVGKNGIGKTNILEAIALITSTRSFRHNQITQLVKTGKTEGRITAQLTDGNRNLQSELWLEPGKRRYFINGKLKKTQEVQGVLPAVAFTPDDLEFAKGSSSIKRATLDNLGMQLSSSYYVVYHDYEKALRYKNKLLKDEASPPLIDSINETLITCGTQLYWYRTSLIKRLLPLVVQNYQRIADVCDKDSETLTGTYLPSWLCLAGQTSIADDGMETLSRNEIKKELEQALEHQTPQEITRKRSLVGPHNDKITFYLGGHDVAVFASQGQQRSLVLAWKLAEVDFIFESLGVYPVLLLDDVMSELDVERRNMLIHFMNTQTQTFITATDLSGLNKEFVSHADVHWLK